VNQPGALENACIARCLLRYAGLEKDFFDLNALTTDQMKRFIRQYCDAHPLASYRNAVGELMKALPIILRQK
jgi:hypothetical protein